MENQEVEYYPDICSVTPEAIRESLNEEIEENVQAILAAKVGKGGIIPDGGKVYQSDDLDKYRNRFECIWDTENDPEIRDNPPSSGEEEGGLSQEENLSEDELDIMHSGTIDSGLGLSDDSGRLI